MNKDGVVSIGIEYKKEFNQMISDYESALSEMASNKTLSKGMKAQFENVIAELRAFKAEMDKQLSDLSVGKVDVAKFDSFKKSVSKKFEAINGDISTLNTAVSLLNEKMDMVGNGVNLSKVQNEFKGLEDYITRTNNAVGEFIKSMDGQGIHLFSYDKTNQKEIQSAIKMIDSELKNLDKDYGAKFELFDEKEAQNELDKLATELKNTMDLLESAKSRLSIMDSSSDIFKKTTGEISALELKAARLSDTMEILYDTASEKKFSIDITDDKNLASYDKYIDELSVGLDEVSRSAEAAKKELSSLLGDIKNANPVQVSDNLNPNSAQLTAGVTVETDSNELWKKLTIVLTDLQEKLNSNPVIAPVKLVVAPTAVSQNDNPDQSISTAYSKKYAKKLAQTGEDAVIDMEGVYKKTYTSIMDEAVKCAEESIAKIQEIFEKAPIDIKLQLSQEELDKINNFVLSNKDEKKIDISGQIDKVKSDVSELNDKLKETTELVQKATQNGSVKFDGIEEFTKQITNGLSSLEKLQDILKTLQNVEITLANASGLSSITEIDNQWESLTKRINNAIKVDGTFRKNANVSKLASEYQKYLDMGGKNELSSISKLKDNETVINSITSKMKELASQKVDTSSVDKAVDSFDKFKTSLDDIISKLDHLVNLTKNIGNTFYKMFKDAYISDTGKQWSSIESKFKSIADESGKINLSKQKKDVTELLTMYQKYVENGGIKTPFDLTDNVETVKKLEKVYKQLNDTKAESKSDDKTVVNLEKVNEAVTSISDNLENKQVQAASIAATAMEDSAERQISALTSVVDNINMIVEGLKKIKGIKIPTLKIDDGSGKKSGQKAETNISSGNSSTLQQQEKIQHDITNSIQEQNKAIDESIKKTLTLNDVRQKQWEIIQRTNPKEEGTNSTWVDTPEDVKTFYEVNHKDTDYPFNENYSDDWTVKDKMNVEATGKITVYSSYPIKDGNWITPSKEEGLSYAGSGKLYSATMDPRDIAWVDAGQGQVAHISDELKEVIDLATKAETQIQDIDSKANETNNIQSIANKLDEEISKYETIVALVKEYYELSHNRQNTLLRTKADDRLSAIRKELKSYERNPDYNGDYQMGFLGSGKNIFSDSVDLSQEEMLKEICTILGVEIPQNAEKAERAIKEVSFTTPGKDLKDAIQVDNSSATNDSTSAIKEENNALEQTSQSAEKAANNKKKFAKANQEVKASADASKSPIKEEADALEEVAKAAEKSKNRQKAKDDTQASVNNALKDQITAWKNIQSIREKIEKADNSDEVSNLQQVKKEYQQNYIEASKILKANTSLYDSELQVAKLEQIRLETNKKIADYQTSQLSGYEKQRKSYIDKLTGYTDTSKYTTDFVNRASALKKEITNLNFTNPQDVTSLQKIDAEVVQINSDSKLLENKLVKQQSKLAEIISQMKIFKSQNTNMSGSQKVELDQIIKYAETIQKSGKEVASEVEDIKVRFSGLKAEVNATGNTGKNFFDQIGSRLTDMNSKFVAQFLSWQDWIRYGRQALDTIVELDDALVDLKKTTTMSSSELENFYYDSNNVAKQMGVTTEEIINQASAWSRLGFSSAEASTQMSKLSAQFAAISPGMDIDKATDGLVSTMKAFDIDVSNVQREVMDNINKIGNTAATSNDEIVDMLTRSSAAMSAANNTLEETIALETAAVEITRSAETTGTAFKTLSMRLRGYDEETESYTGDVEELSGAIADLTKTASTPGGISLFTDDTKQTYKSTYELLKEISQIYDQLSDKNQADICLYVQKCA